MAVSKKRVPPERGDIVWIQLDPQAGREMKGLYPILVISPLAFNERTGIVIGFPMTYAECNTDSPFAIAVQGPKKEIGYVLCHQPTSFDWAVRGAGQHPWGAAPKLVVREALDRLDAICGICEN
jgi:mRNA interferase MazF